MKKVQLNDTIIRYSGRGVAISPKNYCKRNNHITKIQKVKNVKTLDRHGFITPDMILLVAASNITDKDERRKTSNDV